MTIDANSPTTQKPLDPALLVEFCDLVESMQHDKQRLEELKGVIFDRACVSWRGSPVLRCQSEKCDRLFLPVKHAGSKYCGRTCLNREKKRAQRKRAKSAAEGRA